MPKNTIWIAYNISIQQIFLVKYSVLEYVNSYLITVINITIKVINVISKIVGSCEGSLSWYIFIEYNTIRNQFLYVPKLGPSRKICIVSFVYSKRN